MEPTMYCDSCRRYFDNSLIDCPECDMEPLLDISDPEVVEVLRQQDEIDRRALSRKWSLIPLILPLTLFLLGLEYASFLPPVVIAMAAVVLGVVLHRKFGFKPRPLPRGGV
jgi:hypothetical protein